MDLKVTTRNVSSILTRTSGFLRTVSSHSLQPYRGCTFGNALCGAYCYVQHNGFLTEGARWGSFLEVRSNSASKYKEQYEAERAWARRARGRFSIFMSSSTDPFLPQENQYRITQRVLEAMRQMPPDLVIVQTHSHTATEYMELYSELATRCDRSNLSHVRAGVKEHHFCRFDEQQAG